MGYNLTIDVTKDKIEFGSVTGIRELDDWVEHLPKEVQAKYPILIGFLKESHTYDEEFPALKKEVNILLKLSDETLSEDIKSVIRNLKAALKIAKKYIFITM